MHELSHSEREAIRQRVRKLMLQDLATGISATERVLCHNCGHTKPSAGTVHHGRYRLCNDCAVQYEIALAEGRVQTIDDFVI